MQYKMRYKNFILVAILFILLVISEHSVLATSVSRMFITNLEAYPGEVIKQKITLEGSEPEERSGFWYTHYKKTEGDSDKMDITSWITITPKDYSIKTGEVKAFVVEVKIPKNAEPGLWGATTKEAGNEGHSEERRTYIVFKDALSDGNVYSGLLIPISVHVLSNSAPLAGVLGFIEKNIAIIVLSIIILILLILVLKKRRSARK